MPADRATRSLTSKIDASKLVGYFRDINLDGEIELSVCCIRHVRPRAQVRRANWLLLDRL